MLTLLTSLIMFNILYYTFEIIFIKETPFGFEFSFEKIKVILNYFYEGYHLEATLLNLILTLLISVFISYSLIKLFGIFFIQTTTNEKIFFSTFQNRYFKYCIT